jgi:hypothetical protein
MKKKTPAWGETGADRRIGEAGGLGHAIRRSSPTNDLQVILFRSRERICSLELRVHRSRCHLFTP